MIYYSSILFHSIIVPNCIRPESEPGALYFPRLARRFLQLPADPSNGRHGYIQSRIYAESSMSIQPGWLQSTGLLLQTFHHTITDHLIKVRFKIDTESFVCGTYINDKEERNYDYLLPLRVEALNNIDYHKLKIEYQESAKEVKVLLTLPGDNKQKTQVYRTQISTDNAEEKYTIIAFEEYVANVNLGIFPFLCTVCKTTKRACRGGHHGADGAMVPALALL